MTVDHKIIRLVACAGACIAAVAFGTLFARAQDNPAPTAPSTVVLPAFSANLDQLKIQVVIRYQKTPAGTVVDHIFVRSVKAGSIAEKSGLKKGMEIVAIQYQLVAGLNQFQVDSVLDQPVQDSLVLSVKRSPKSDSEELRIPVVPPDSGESEARWGQLAPPIAGSAAAPARPANALHAGFTLQPLNYEVQHPYDLKQDARYSYDSATDTHDLWVLDTDKPHAPPPNRTEPRTELRLRDDNYKPGTGLHMMDCDLFIVPGTFACISQVFGTGPMCIIIVDPRGTISDLRTHAVIAQNMNGKWFNWTVVHDSNATGAGAIRVYIDGKLTSAKIAAKPEASYYFKIGVYSRANSHRNEVKVRNLRYLVKASQ